MLNSVLSSSYESGNGERKTSIVFVLKIDSSVCYSTMYMQRSYINLNKTKINTHTLYNTRNSVIECWFLFIGLTYIDMLNIHSLTIILFIEITTTCSWWMSGGGSRGCCQGNQRQTSYTTRSFIDDLNIDTVTWGVGRVELWPTPTRTIISTLSLHVLEISTCLVSPWLGNSVVTCWYNMTACHLFSHTSFDMIHTHFYYLFLGYISLKTQTHFTQ